MTGAELRKALWPDAKSAPVRTLECRHCGRRNRVCVPDAVLCPADCACGSCGKALFLRPQEPLAGLSSSAYEHSLDRKSLDALRSLPGFSALMRRLLSGTAGRQVRLLARSQWVECGPRQFPQMLSLLDRARERLGYEPRPLLFLGESPVANAFASGAEQPIVVVQAGLLDLMDDAQLVAVLGHELGHLQAEHGLYHFMAALLGRGVEAFGGLGKVVAGPLQLALLKWYRCSELTADRAALLATRDLAASLGVLMALAGGGRRAGTRARTRFALGPFVEQARALAEAEKGDFLDGVFATLLSLEQTHPFATWRVMHLLDWVERGSYLDIVAGRYARVAAKTAEAPPAPKARARG